MACRQDWAARQRFAQRGPYRLLDDAVVDEVFDGSWSNATRAMIAMAQTELGRMPDELAADETVFLPIYETYRNHWAAIMCEGQIVAKWALPFLLPEDEAKFKAGHLIEVELSVDRCRRPILPGTYYGYCPALIIRPGHEAASTLLISSFVRFLETLAEREILLHGIGALSCSPSGFQVCRDLGMTRIGSHRVGPGFGVWDLPGTAISGSVFARRSSLLRRCYADAFTN